MADIVKELYNGEVLYGNYVNGTQTLYSTNGTKTAVIKDVQVGTSGYTTAPTLQVGGFDVATLAASATGSEIVGTNSSIVIKNNDTTVYSAASISYVDNPSSTPKYYAATDPTPVVFGSSAGTTTQGSSSTVGTMSGSTQVSWAYYVNGIFIYYTFDGNSSAQAYYRTGLTGSDTSIFTGSYQPIVYDGNGKMYVWGSDLYCYDTVTNTYSAITSGNPMGWSWGSTYPMMAYANGFIFYQRSDNNSIGWYKISDGTYGWVNGSAWSHSNYCCNPSVFYDASTYTYRIVVTSTTSGRAGTYYYYDMVSNAGGTSFTYVSNGTGLYPTLAGVGNPGIKISSPYSGKYHYCFGHSSNSNTVYQLDKNLTMTPVATVTNASFGGYTVGTVNTAAATTEQLNTYGAKIKLRITGVESTL